MSQLERNNYLFYEFKKNDKAKPTIVFIHGITGSSSAWNKYYNYFFKLGYNVLKLDLRGHGLSLKQNSFNYYKIENLAEDLFNILKINNIKNPILISHSFGTFVLLEFIKNYPKYNISKIIFISSIYKLKFNKLSQILIKIGTYLPIFRKKGLQIDYSKYFKNTKDFTLKRVIVESLNTNIKVISSLFNSVENSKYDENLFKKINCPVLLIHGREDKVSNYNTSVNISKNIKNSTLKIYDNLDHIIVLNNYDDIIKDIQEFIIN